MLQRYYSDSSHTHVEQKYVNSDSSVTCKSEQFIEALHKMNA